MSVPEERFPVVGDIITSENFTFGRLHSDCSVQIMPGQSRHVETLRISEEERVKTAAKTGNILPKYFEVDVSANDESRMDAEFVVECALMDGGDKGLGMTQAEVTPDGWHIKARRRSDDGSNNPEGEVVDFYLSGYFKNQLDPDDVSIIGKDLATIHRLTNQ